MCFLLFQLSKIPTAFVHTSIFLFLSNHFPSSITKQNLASFQIWSKTSLGFVVVSTLYSVALLDFSLSFLICVYPISSTSQEFKDHGSWARFLTGEAFSFHSDISLNQRTIEPSPMGYNNFLRVMNKYILEHTYCVPVSLELIVS